MDEGVAYGVFYSELSRDELTVALMKREDLAHTPRMDFKLYNLDGEADDSNIPRNLIALARNGGMNGAVEARLTDYVNADVATRLFPILQSVCSGWDFGVFFLGENGVPHFISRLEKTAPGEVKQS